MTMSTRAWNCWRTAKILFFDYAAHSTIHGVNYIAERNRSWFERIWWIVAFCLSILGCTKLIFDAWNINPIIISFTGKPTPIWQIPFPAITICPTIPTDSQNLRNIVEKFDYFGVRLNKVSEEE
jgi:acid-sensing ion channel, other